MEIHPTPTNLGDKMDNKNHGKPAFPAPVFSTLAILDSTNIDPNTGIALPSDMAVQQAKEWIEAHGV